MERVLIIRPGALGDTLMLLPALRDLAGKAAVTVVGRRPGLDFIRPHVDCALDLEVQGWHRLFEETPDDEAPLVSGIDLVAAFFTRGEETIRQNLGRLVPAAAIHICRSFPREGEPVHVALYLARCLKEAGLPVNPDHAVAFVNQGGLCRGPAAPGIEKPIVLHPGSGSRRKNHPPEFWVELTRRLGRDSRFRGYQRRLLLGPAEAPFYHLFSENLQADEVDIVMSGTPHSLREALDGSSLYVGHDSGVTHLAGMWGIPTVAIFRTSDPVQWAPLGPFVRLIEAMDPDPGLYDRIFLMAGELIGLAAGG